MAGTPHARRVKYLLDSNTIIALVLDADAGVTARAGQCTKDDIVTSSIAYAEVAYGSENGKMPNIDELRTFVEEVPILAFDAAAARAYATLPFRRGGFDRLIAAHALALDLTIVTNNERDFKDVPGVKIENWTS